LGWHRTAGEKGDESGACKNPDHDIPVLVFCDVITDLIE
jgi:hypothetical protein